MLEALDQTPLRLERFQDFVDATRYEADPSLGWQDRYSHFILEEQLEFLGQHGPGVLLLLPNEIATQPTEENENLRFHMADEMGDLLWFGADIASRYNQRLDALCLSALKNHTNQPQQTPQTFIDLESRVLTHAETITVPNKLGLLQPDHMADIGRTSLAQHPQYVFMRTAHRLSRSLDQGKNDISPPTATELEPLQDIARSVGTYLLTLAYIATNRLGVSIDNIAKFNMAKLTHRKQYSKANDIHFDRTFLERFTDT